MDEFAAQSIFLKLHQSISIFNWKQEPAFFFNDIFTEIIKMSKMNLLKT
jgi:hypothetical protein